MSPKQPEQVPTRAAARGRLAIAIVAVGLTAAALFAPAVSGRPFRSHVPWSVLLCKFSDQTVEQQTPSYFSRFLTDAGATQGGVAQYWRTVSSGGVDLAGSVVKGWYTMGVTLAQSRAQGKTRASRIDDCVNAAGAGGYSVPSGNRTIAIINGQVDSGSAGGRVLLDPLAWNNAFAAHEMGHGIDLQHSFSDDPTYRNVSWAQIGEYDDPWDLMSAMNIFTASVGSFSPDPPGLNAEHLDREGWMARNQILTFGSDGTRSRTITLTDLYAPGSAGIRDVRVPFDPNDLFRYYTVELRIKRDWDGGIPASAVLIHEVKRNTGGVPTTYLLRNATPSRGGTGQPTTPTNSGTYSRDPARGVAANGVTIRLNSIDALRGTASVAISSEMPGLCRRGYVWREARRSDHVCVTPAVRGEVRADNAAAQSRRQPGAGYTCRQGYVWREAFFHDFVCVIPSRRRQARLDNAQATRRNNPARDVFGPNTCKPGYVWREADQRDWVCVTPAVRSDVRADNAAAGARRQPGAGLTCLQGFVWREAFPRDYVCVVPSRRTQARVDNAAASSRLMVP